MSENTTPLLHVTVTDDEYKIHVTDRENNPLPDHPATYMVMTGPNNLIAFVIDMSGEHFRPEESDDAA